MSKELEKALEWIDKADGGRLPQYKMAYLERARRILKQALSNQVDVGEVMTKESIIESAKLFHMLRSDENNTSATANYWDYEEYGVWFSLEGIVEFVQQLLTKPTQSLDSLRDEIIEDLVKEFNDNMFVKCKNGEFLIIRKDYQHPNGDDFVHQRIGGDYITLVGTNIELAHKITTYFMRLKESE